MAKSTEAEQLEKMKFLETRIKAPSIWGRYPGGIRFEDLQERRYEDAVRLLKKHYLTEEAIEMAFHILQGRPRSVPYVICDDSLPPVRILYEICNLIHQNRVKCMTTNTLLLMSHCGIEGDFCAALGHNAVMAVAQAWYQITYRSVKIADDKEGMDEFTHQARIWMKDKMSIAAVKEGTDKLVGVLIMRIQEKQAFSRTFSRVKITYNPLYSTVVAFNNELEKPVNLFEKLGVRRYFKIYVLALKPRYRHRGISKEMLKGAISLSMSANVPAIAGFFTTGRGQQIADSLGFVKFNEIYYVRYIIDDQIVFWDTGLGNYGAALMGYRIPSVEEPEEIQPQASSRFNVQVANDEDETT